MRLDLTRVELQINAAMAHATASVQLGYLLLVKANQMLLLISDQSSDPTLNNGKTGWIATDGSLWRTS